MTAAEAIQGFYAVLDRDDVQLARTLLASGVRVLQVRLKPWPPAAAVPAGDLARVARMARKLCDDVGAALIVNDRVDVALAVGADGVHLGQTDLPLASARAVAGHCLWIGVSTHNLAQVRQACAGGADYLGFGPVFATRTKHDPDPVQGIAGLQAAVLVASGRPLVAIGGITPSRAAEVYAAGASALCAIGAVNDASDVAATAARMGRNAPG